MTRPFKAAREQARAKNALLHRGREGKINVKGKELIKNAKAKARAAARNAASTAKNVAQTHGIPSMPRTNMIPV